MPGGKVTEVELGGRKPGDLSLLPFGEESLGDSALIENLDGACMQSAGTRAGKILAGATLDDGNVDLRQREFAREHQPRRSASGDHHRMFVHRTSSFTMSAKFDLARGPCRKPRGACQCPLCTCMRLSLHEVYTAARPGLTRVCSRQALP